MQSAVADAGLEVRTIRAAFPALDRIHEGRPVAYFDGPGGTQVPRAVAEAMADYLFHHNANTHWKYPSSDRDGRRARGRPADARGVRQRPRRQRSRSART